MNFIINRCRRKSPLQSLSASWLTTGKSHRCHHQHCHHLCRYIVYLRIAKTDNFPKRMREMFKPSMAELGLCMYQVFNIIMNNNQIVNIIMNDHFYHNQSYNFHHSLSSHHHHNHLYIPAGHPGPGAHTRPLCPLSIPSKCLPNKKINHGQNGWQW